MSVAAAGGGNDDNGGGERRKWKGILEIPDSPPSTDEDTDHDDDGGEGESMAGRRGLINNMYSLKQARPLKMSRSWTEISGIKIPKRLAKNNPITKKRRLGNAHNPLRGVTIFNWQSSSKPAHVPDHRQNKHEDEEDDKKEGQR